MKLVIIEGATSTGKSTLATRLAGELKMRAFLKDDYKEGQFNRLPSKPTLKQLAYLEKKSWEEVFKAIEMAVQHNESLIVEGNFFPSHSRKIKRILRQDTVVVEIYCYAKGRTILKRYVRRNRQGHRHKGHRDHLWYPIVALESLTMRLERSVSPLKLSSHLLKVDTNDFAAVDYAKIRKFILGAR